ncbi:riboflavin biosynthesis protein RibD [Methylolobus aquaticus]|nr:riboflavin biosynthesis protein RibD [Methylolobus aquaticus]
MSKQLLRLFPSPAECVPLQGLYLDLALHQLGTPADPFVYANFLCSLDGRIALEDATGQTYLPKTLTTPDDFRLFLELAAQSDCLITHGGYLRSLAEGRLGNILQIGLVEPHRDLLAWRVANGLPPQPDVVVASASLDFPMPDSLAHHGQRCCIATGAGADSGRIAAWQAKGYEVLVTGTGETVEGAALIRALGQRGYRRPYLIAGPHMLDTMLRDGCLVRLFQTTTHQLLGGQAFRTLLPGPELGSAGHLKLVSMYYDDSSPEGTGQVFAQFRPMGASAA